MDTANAWVESYIAAHNRRFAVTPGEPEDAHVPWFDDLDKLNLLRGHYEERTLSKTLSCQFHKRIVQVDAPTEQRRLASQTVQIIQPLDGDFIIMHGKQELPCSVMQKKDRIKPVVDAKALAKRAWDLRQKGHKPAAHHPWKRWTGSTPNPQAASLSHA